MKLSLQTLMLLCALGLMGCRAAPGKPAAGSEAERPDQVLDFTTLYKENCSACHGEQGRLGAAISLANPAYLAFAGASNLTRITANGVPGTMMPPFSQQAGGMLTGRQIEVLTQGMLQRWSKPSSPAAPAIGYAETLKGDAANGALVFATTCARCHGAGETGSPATGMSGGSLVEPAYLALISDQGLRSIIVAGQPGEGMPGADSVGAHPLTDRDVSDIVAWLGTHRTPAPGQPYGQHASSTTGDRNE
jgi:cytochrome c oxidase cbb3-type subunit 3/ubiquinol-cytochrome c reductase cytochrome c subunit